jgi:hypothetical protein
MSFSSQLVIQLEAGDVDVFAITSNGAKLYRNSEDGSAGWTSITPPTDLNGATMSQVAIGATSLWLVDSAGKLRVCPLPCSGGSDFSIITNAPANIVSIDAGKMSHADI